MFNNFNSRHNREAKSLYKLVSFQIPRLLRIPEPGEITTLSPFRRAALPPFTVVVNGLATIVATQSLQLGTVSAISAVFFDSDILFSRSYLRRNYCFSDFLLVFFQNGGFAVSQKCDFSVRIFKITKYQNILTFTVWRIVPITSLISQNCQFGRLVANYSKSPNLHFCSFWSNVISSSVFLLLLSLRLLLF